MLTASIKEYIDKQGIKKKHVAEKAGMTENALHLALNGKRKLLADEYVSICRALGVSYDRFIKKTDDSKQ